MACREDIRTSVLNTINDMFTKDRYTFVRVQDNVFNIANQQSTGGKSRAQHLKQATAIANHFRLRVIQEFGNNVDVNVEVPYYVGLPVRITVEPTFEYVEKLFGMVTPEKRTEVVSRMSFLQDPALYQQELTEEIELKIIPQTDIIAEQVRVETDRLLTPQTTLTPETSILDKKGQFKLFQERGREVQQLKENILALKNTEAYKTNSIPALIEKVSNNTTKFENTVINELLIESKKDNLPEKAGQSYVFLSKKDAENLSYLFDKFGEYPKEFKTTKKITKFERVKGTLDFKAYNEYRDITYIKSNKNKKSNLYDVVDSQTGELFASKVRLIAISKDVKSGIAKKYGLEFEPTKVFNANRSIAFALYRQKPSKAKYVAQAKKYLYDAIKFLNPQETNLKINLDLIENLLSAYPEQMWDYINTTYSPENSVNINAATSLQDTIKFSLPKLGLIQALERITGEKLQGVSFKNYDRTGSIKKILRVNWGEDVTIDYTTMTRRELHKAISYYLKSKNYFKPSSEELNVKKYAEHKGIDYYKLKNLVFGDIDEAIENIAYNTTGNSDEMEVSKWRESIRNYDWQSFELFKKPYEDYKKTVAQRISEKFKDKELSNGISHLDYFFSGNFNWLNINFNNISGQYYGADMETAAGTGVNFTMKGILNPWVEAKYTKPTPGKSFLKEEEVFNRLAAILHEPFHALHALSYGSKEEMNLRKAFDSLYNTAFGNRMMEEVFGSGYNAGKQISYETLYKEFSAFATQLILYPKEWITKTDLRSNDIAEFVAKIQNLQDRTYTEIEIERQKIGTVEKINISEEDIKLSFLEKLYNFIVSALNKIVPLSRKFTKLISTSKIVSEKIVEDVFQEVETKVQKVEALPQSIKNHKEEFLNAMDDFKVAINTLLQIDSSAFSSDNVMKFFVEDRYMQDADRVNSEISENSERITELQNQETFIRPIKPGVEELFESNPELANQVYEALGFKNNSKEKYEKIENLTYQNFLKLPKKDIEDILVYHLSTYPSNLPSVGKPLLFGASYSELPNDFYPELKFNKIFIKYEDGQFNLYKNKVDNSGITKPKNENNLTKEEEDKILSEELLGYNRFNREWELHKEDISSEDLSKFIQYSGKLEKEIYSEDDYKKAFDWWYNNEKNKLDNPKITVKRKQQAQQLYSSYLQTTNNPTIEGFKQWNNRQKQINELFESNESLANAVYEALGFENKLKTSLGKELEYKDAYVSVSRLKDFKQYQVLDEKGNDIGSVVIEYRGDKTVILHPKLNISGKGYGKDLYKFISNKFGVEIQEWNEAGISKSDSAKAMWDSLEKEGTAKRIIDEEQGDNFRVLKYINQITPQQKQQALQLYSRYLDSIFPDSKVKDIVYHGSSQEIKDSFRDNFTEEGYSNGIFFTDSKSYLKELSRIKDTSKITSVIINAQDNKKIEEPLGYNVGQYWLFEQYDSIRGKDAGQTVEGNIYAVATKNQIHILGNKQDIGRFKEFVASQPSPTENVEELNELTSIPEVRNEIYFQATKCK